MQKTNAMRLLDAAGIAYRTATYPVDLEDLSGVHAAQLLGIPPAGVYKTLVLQSDKGSYLVCCIAVDREVDLKALAALAGVKSAAMIPQKDLLGVTGYLRGGCSPIGMKKKFPTFLDQAALQQPTIAVSAGQRGVQLLLSPGDLQRYLTATTAIITKE